MTKQAKNIVIYLFLMIGIALFLHAVIPFDHHDIASCENPHHNHDHNEKDARHCHLLSEIILDKTLKQEQQKHFRFKITDFADLHANTTQTVKPFFRILFVQAKEQVKFRFKYIKNNPSRGSPATA